MPVYIVALAAGTQGCTLKQGANALIVFAADATQAKEIANAYFDGDGTIWTGATATEVTTTDDWEGWTFEIIIDTPVPKKFTYVGTAANDTVDEIAAQLVILLNADAEIAGASYNGTTNVLTIAETTDGLGDHNVTVTITPPSGRGYSSIPSLVGTIVDGGSSGDALTVALPADALVPPKTLYAVKTT